MNDSCIDPLCPQTPSVVVEFDHTDHAACQTHGLRELQNHPGAVMRAIGTEPYERQMQSAAEARRRELETQGFEPVRAGITGWWCPSCEEIHNGEPQKQSFFTPAGRMVEEFIGPDGDYITASTEIKTIEVIVCPDNFAGPDNIYAISKSEVIAGEIVKCGNCDEAYTGPDAVIEARRCCLYQWQRQNNK